MGQPAKKLEAVPTLTQQISNKEERLALLNQRAADATSSSQAFQRDLDAARAVSDDAFFASVETPTERYKEEYADAKKEVMRLLVENEEGKDTTKRLPKRIDAMRTEIRILKSEKEVLMRKKCRQMYEKKSEKAFIAAQKGIIECVVLQTVIKDNRMLKVDDLVGLVRDMYVGESFRENLVTALAKLIEDANGDEI